MVKKTVEPNCDRFVIFAEDINYYKHKYMTTANPTEKVRIEKLIEELEDSLVILRMGDTPEEVVKLVEQLKYQTGNVSATNDLEFKKALYLNRNNLVESAEYMRYMKLHGNPNAAEDTYSDSLAKTDE